MTFDSIPFPPCILFRFPNIPLPFDLPKRNAFSDVPGEYLGEKGSSGLQRCGDSGFGAEISREGAVFRFPSVVVFDGGCVFRRAALFWKIYPFFWGGRGEFRLVAGEKKKVAPCHVEIGIGYLQQGVSFNPYRPCNAGEYTIHLILWVLFTITKMSVLPAWSCLRLVAASRKNLKLN